MSPPENDPELLCTAPRRWGAQALQYALTAAAVAAVLGLRLLIDPFWGNAMPYVTFFLALVFIVWFADLGPALFAIAASLVLADFFFSSPRHTFGFTTTGEWLNALFFTFISGSLLVFARKARGALAQALANLTALEAKAAELKASEDRFRVLLDAAPDSALLLEPNGKIVAANAIVAKALRRQVQDLPGSNAFEHLTAEIAVRRRARFDEAVRTGRAVAFEDEREGLRIESFMLPLQDGRGGVKLVAVFGRDITERRRAEQALRDSEERFRRLAEASFEGVLITAQGRIRDCNDQLAAIFGVPRSRLIGKDVGVLLPPEICERVMRDLHQGREAASEHEVLRADGSRRTVVAHGRPVGDLEEMRVTVVRDVTEQKRTEAALREAVERQSMALELGRAFVFEWNPLTDKVIRSEHAAEVMGLSGNAAVEDTGGSFFQRIHPEDRPNFVARLRGLTAADDHYQTLYRVLRPGGDEVVLEESAKASFDAAGKMIVLRGITQDVTVREMAKAALRKTTERLELAQSASRAGTWDWNLKTGEIEWSRELFVLFGLDPERQQANFTTWEQIMHPDDIAGAREHIHEAVRLGTPLDSEYRIVLPDGQVRWIGARGKTFCDAAGRPERMIGICIDITHPKSAEEELRETKERLARHNEELEIKVRERTDELNAFCHSVAHDLRGPIRTQVGFARLLLDMFGEQLGEKGRDYAQRVAQAAERQADIIQDLMAYISLSRADVPVESVSLAEVLEMAQADLALELQERDALVEAIGLDNCQVLANSSSLHLILLNLLSNAFKFVPQGTKPEVRVWAENRAGHEPKTDNGGSEVVRLWVEDNGIGIEARDMGRLFGLFQRLHKAGSYSGTGMGLANVKKAAERMGGRVGVESEPGKGSRFWVELPAAVMVSNPSALELRL